ncbi:hypothetical protein IWQ60_007990 [Tieghemiomyces parasiticus]|uniref:Tyrosinase copper-binding domain-containing protein n=1 Tax=Tieghemiomyces parasiticus TaxID=78921 RepID=A0A9W8DT63_9FUNG|nr:hypothetical protein IWQ60_007990 [Tieghemiomyces parasiticus]
MRFSLLFTAVAAFASAFAADSASPGTCSTIRVRREIRQLSAQERAAFFAAIWQLNEGPRPTIWDSYAQLHSEAGMLVHRSPRLFPFHRRLLLDLEERLDAILPGFALPYWDWTLDARDPASSTIFSPTRDWFGSQGTCVRDGGFANFGVWYTESGVQPHCLSRRFDRGAQMSPMFPPSAIANIIVNNQDYDLFRFMIETGPHNLLHRAMGGDMGTMVAPNDPIFFLHHAFVDRLWSEWQALPGRFARYDGSAGGQAVSLQDALPHYGDTVRSMLNITELCYRYAPSGTEVSRRLTANQEVFN